MEAFLLGTLDVFRVKDTDDVMVIGRGKGKVMTGNAVYISNPGTPETSVGLAVIREVSVSDGKEWKPVDEAENCLMAVKLEGGIKFHIKRSTVLYTREATTKEVHDTYIAALGDAYVVKAGLDIKEEELERMSLTDLDEIWRLNNWYHSEKLKDEPEEAKKLNRERLDPLCKMMCKKLLLEDSIYCVYSKDTGEPFLFSKTLKRDPGYLCTPPNIRVITSVYKSVYEKSYDPAKFELKEIKNGEDKKGIFNFLGEAFYFNGAEGVEIISDRTAIGAGALVKKPDFSGIPAEKIPVTNPDVLKWMLLLGQLGEPTTEDAKLIYNLYFGFLSKALPEAKFLIPMKKEDGTLIPDENGNVTFEKGTKIGIVTQKGKDGRQAVRMYTDWKRFRSKYGDEYGGLIQKVDEIISTMDVIINVTDFQRAGCYIDQTMYGKMKELRDKMASGRKPE